MDGAVRDVHTSRTIESSQVNTGPRSYKELCRNHVHILYVLYDCKNSTSLSLYDIFSYWLRLLITEK
jgi:hypothetical protein